MLSDARLFNVGLSPTGMPACAAADRYIWTLYMNSLSEIAVLSK